MLLDMTKKILDEACRVIGEENRDILDSMINLDNTYKKKYLINNIN